MFKWPQRERTLGSGVDFLVLSKGQHLRLKADAAPAMLFGQRDNASSILARRRNQHLPAHSFVSGNLGIQGIGKQDLLLLANQQATRTLGIIVEPPAEIGA